MRKCSDVFGRTSKERWKWEVPSRWPHTLGGVEAMGGKSVAPAEVQRQEPGAAGGPPVASALMEAMEADALEEMPPSTPPPPHAATDEEQAAGDEPSQAPSAAQWQAFLLHCAPSLRAQLAPPADGPTAALFTLYPPTGPAKSQSRHAKYQITTGCALLNVSF